MTKKNYHHGDLAAELLKNARQLIDAGQALTMRKVAAMSGVSATAAYRHFADKEALLAGVLENAFYELAEQLEAARLNSDNPIDGFFNVGRGYIRFAVENPNCYQLLFSPACKKLMHPDLLAAGQQAFQVVLTAAEACHEKHLLGKRRPQDIAMIGWVNVHGLVSLYLDGIFELVVDSDLATATDNLFSTLLQGIMPSSKDFISQAVSASIQRQLKKKS